MPRPILAWHFLPASGRLNHGDGREAVVGKTLRVKGKPELCRRGLHASEELADAERLAEELRLERPWLLCRVAVGGCVVRDRDKLVGTTRKLLASIRWDDPRVKGIMHAYSEAAAPARKAYDEAVATARKAYDEAVAPARKAYDEAVATASKAYDEAVAPARKAYDEAVAIASKAYDEAAAPARKAYDEAVAPARKARDRALLSLMGLQVIA